MKKMNNDRGISLLEVMIGMLILAFGLLGLAPMFTVAIEGNIVSRDTSIASDLIKEKIEYYESVDSLPTTPYYEYEAGLDTVFARTTRIEDHVSDSTIPDGMHRIEVVVAWTDKQAVSRSSSYTTYLIEDDD